MKRTLSFALAMILVLGMLLGGTSAYAEEKAGKFKPGENGEVVISHWGGSTAEAYRECYFDDFEKDTGIKVVEVIATNNMSKLEAMVNTGTVDVDIMQGSGLELNHFETLYEDTGVKYIADMDFSYFDPADLEGLTTDYPNAVGAFAYASILAYSTDAFPEGNRPDSWEDFWNVEEFPGMRTMVSGVSGDYPPLEYALLADGVAPEDLYPIDVDRAFAKLEEIKPNMLKWWMSGAEAPQMLIDGEVVMAEAFSGRIATIKAEGAPVDYVYNGGGMVFDLFFCPEGAPNYENAMKLLAYMVQPERQAKFAEMSNYAPDNQLAYQYLDPEFAATLVTNPENVDKCFMVDNKYWAANMYDVQERWLAWEGEG